MRAGSMADEPDSIPVVPWESAQKKIRKVWVPKDRPHHSIIGLTGSGKSFLVRHGIMPMVKFDHVCIVDVKGDDPTLEGLGKPVKKLPSDERISWKRVFEGKREPEPERHWYRLMVPDDRNAAREMVSTALQKCYKEGNWIIYLDETRHLTDRRAPFLDLTPQLEHIWMKGRSRRVCIVACSQEPRWLPGSFYSQASFAWIGRVRDERMQQRLTEVGGMTRKMLPQIASIKPHEWVVAITGAEEEFALTKIVK